MVYASQKEFLKNMSIIIDRRLNPRDKALKNRQRFIQRSREEIKKAVKEAIDTDNIADIEDGKVKIRTKRISEPGFEIDHKTGNKRHILPTNDHFIAGDKENKPDNGDYASGREGGFGRSEDDFEFILNQDEFLDFIFKDLELPDLVKKQMKNITKTRLKRAGFTNSGNPTQLDVVRSLKNSLGRRIGLNRPKDKQLEDLEKELEYAEINDDQKLIDFFEDKIIKLKYRRIVIPWLDPVDVRYRNFLPTPHPITQAVMLCIMDVSGSMGQREKDLAKRFFFLLHMFLRRKYEKVDIIFIRHHEEATEVTEDEFFLSRESGGTLVSSGLRLAKQIIDDRYAINDWNIYIAQASDGDNVSNDNSSALLVMQVLLPIIQYFAYIEIIRENTKEADSNIWESYSTLLESFNNLNMRAVAEVPDIWRVFKELFSKERIRHV
jgi:hypothetical protein